MQSVAHAGRTTKLREPRVETATRYCAGARGGMAGSAGGSRASKPIVRRPTGSPLHCLPVRGRVRCQRVSVRC